MRVSASDPVANALASTELAPVLRSPPRGDEPSTSFAHVLQGLGREITNGESTMRVALRSVGGGADLSAAQLIALQAGVYRYSEAIDLTSRLVDRATSGVKTVVQGSGQ